MKKKANPVKSPNSDKRPREKAKARDDKEPPAKDGNGEHEHAADAPDMTARQRRRKAAAAADDAARIPENAKPTTRLGLLKVRHEAMKREIDQIREDLES